MDIHLSSSLTTDDECVVAPALLKALSSILDALPIEYALRIDTPDGHTFALSEGGEEPSFTSGPPTVPASGHFDS
jgi:hypothetical protein